MKNFRGSALAAGVGTPESAPHELLGSTLIFIWVTNIGTVYNNASDHLGPNGSPRVTRVPGEIALALSF